MLNINWLGKLNKKITYIVAVSGGPDSMFLLDNLFKNGFNIVVCHVNYHKRWSSNVDEKIVQEYCTEYGITLEIKNVKPQDYSKGNFQSQARIIRYDFFNEIAQKYQIYNVIVAHHIYDLLETYLMQKQRKIIASYYGLKFKSTYKSLSIYRPILELKKEDILDYLMLYRIKYGFDETNELLIYERNRIRHQQINKLTDLDINLMLNEIKELNSEQELIKDDLEVIYNTIINENILSIVSFKEYNDNYRLQQMIIHEYLNNYDDILVLNMKKSKIKEVIKILVQSKKPNVIVNLSDSVWLIKEYDYAYISTKNEFYKYEYQIKKPNKYHFKEVNVWKTKPKKETSFHGIFVPKNEFPLTIRTNQGSEEITASFGTKKINRLFIDKKIPLRQRMQWPVVLNKEGKVILIPELAVDKDYEGPAPNLFITLK